MFCRTCANEVDEKAAACPKCGVPPRAGTAFCPNCGKPTAANAVMCPACGIALAKAGADPRANNKLAAGLCGIFLGAFGVHKFVLGYNTAGLIMLLVSVCTCGLGMIAMSPIGLIEGIIYLTKSDEEFVQTYVVNKRPWF